MPITAKAHRVATARTRTASNGRATPISTGILPNWTTSRPPALSIRASVLSQKFAHIFGAIPTVAAVYDRRFYGMLRGKTGGHRPPLQWESQRTWPDGKENATYEKERDSTHHFHFACRCSHCVAGRRVHCFSGNVSPPNFRNSRTVGHH